MRKINDSENLELPDFPPPLPKPSFMPLSTIFLCLFLGGLATHCFYKSNWIGGCFDLFLIAVNVTLAIHRYKSLNNLAKQHQRLIAIHKIITTPVMSEVGNSMILTWLRPSDRLMDEMNEIAAKAKAEINNKKNPKK